MVAWNNRHLCLLRYSTKKRQFCFPLLKRVELINDLIVILSFLCRYYFLAYNASVLYWQFCRPFLKPNYRQYLAKSLHQVVKALDDIDDKDYGWRAQLMMYVFIVVLAGCGF